MSDTYDFSIEDSSQACLMLPASLHHAECVVHCAALWKTCSHREKEAHYPTSLCLTKTWDPNGRCLNRQHHMSLPCERDNAVYKSSALVDGVVEEFLDWSAEVQATSKHRHHLHRACKTYVGSYAAAVQSSQMRLPLLMAVGKQPGASYLHASA